jgi:hypothetical protein
MSRDVDRSAAQANALKTLDQRRNAANNQPLPPLNDTLRQPQSPPQPSPPSPVYRAPGYPAPGPGYQQQASGNGNGLMAGVLGFMLGRAMSQSHQPVSYPTTNGSQTSQQQPAVESPGMVGGMPGLGAESAATLPAAVPAPPPEPSFFTSVLRLFAWLSVLSLMMWAVVYTVRKFRRLRAAPNYSFERN